MARLWLCAVTIGFILAGSVRRAEAAAGIFDLTQLKSICVNVFLTDETRKLGLTEAVVGENVHVWLKRKLPGLQVERFAGRFTGACIFSAPTLTVWGNLDAFTLVEETKLGYYGKVEITLVRETIWESGKGGKGIAYANGILLQGPMSEFEHNVNKAIDALLTEFAAEYYKAGNP